MPRSSAAPARSKASSGSSRRARVPTVSSPSTSRSAKSRLWRPRSRTSRRRRWSGVPPAGERAVPVRVMCRELRRPLIGAMETLLDEVKAGVYEEEEANVLAWRITSLMRAGFDRQAAFLLGLRRDVDLHDAVRLLARGCPPGTALR